jgi:hypothetical protein
MLVRLRPAAAMPQQLSGAGGAGLRWRRQLARTPLHVVELDPDVPAEQAREALESAPEVAYAEPDPWLRAVAAPDDARFAALWGLEQPSDVDVDAPEAWRVTEGDPARIVAIVDTGVDYTHPDLAANVWSNPAEVANGLDDDRNGWVDDLHGVDCASGDGDPLDSDGHGTHVAGTIAAVGNNGIGVVGVSPRTRVMALRFLGPNGGWTSDAIECLEYVRRMKVERGVDVRVVNASWGGTQYSRALSDQIAALDAAGILVVAAAGNDGTDTDARPHYPSAYDLRNVIAVAALARDGSLAPFSNYGLESVDLAAPGVDVLSTVPGGGYERLSGTSMATPHVAGVAALIAAHEPDADVARTRALLLEAVDRRRELLGRVASEGHLNAAAALCEPGDRVLRLEPHDGFRAAVGHDTIVRATLRDCAEPILGASVAARAGDDAGELELVDDGIAPDAQEDDGVYAATWRPAAAGPLELDVSAHGGGAPLEGSASGEVIDIPFYASDDEIAFDWIDASRGVALRIDGDDQSVTVPTGFGFPFYGSAQTRVRVSSNGYLTFGPSGKDYQNRSLPNAEAPGSLVAAYWDDLDLSSRGRVFALREGVAPDRRLTIQWDGVGYYRSSATATFQATLYERDGRIVLRYLDVTTGAWGHDAGASATIGIQDARAAFALLYSAGGVAIRDRTAVAFFEDTTRTPTTALGVAGGSVSLFDAAGNAARRSLRFAAADPAIELPRIGGPSDPYRGGATLHVWSPLTGESASVALPAAGWRIGPGGFRFSGSGPCKSVQLARGRIDARCAGGALDFALVQPRQGAVAVQLALGSRARYCALFGGEVGADRGIGPGERPAPGRFQASGAEAPPECAAR